MTSSRSDDDTEIACVVHYIRGCRAVGDVGFSNRRGPGSRGSPRRDGRYVPEVAQDRLVTFRLRAPEAKAVTVSGDFGNDVEMRRSADGVWSATVGPLDPEM